MEEFNKKFWELVRQANKIVITSHVSPDDVAIASVLALWQIIQQKQPTKKTGIIITGQKTERFAGFTNFKQINFVQDLSQELDEVDLLIMLDGSEYYRFTHQVEELKKNLPANTICLDHHSSPPDQFTLALIEPGQNTSSIVDYLESRIANFQKPEKANVCRDKRIFFNKELRTWSKQLLYKNIYIKND